MGKLKECLRAILREKVVTTEPDKGGLVTLRERRERGRSQMLVEIRQVPSTIIAISLAKEVQHTILRDSPRQSWRKICDYLLVDEGEDGCEIMMVELKTTLQKQAEGLEQLRRSLPLAKYLLSVCEVELRGSWCPRFKYVLIAEKRTNRLDKQLLRPHVEVETEDYDGITVSVGVGTRFDFPALGG